MNGAVLEKMLEVGRREKVRFKIDSCQWIVPRPSTGHFFAFEPRHDLWNFPKVKLFHLPEVSDELEERFQYLAERWREETRGVASPITKVLNLNYLRILALTDRVVPLILKELAQRPDDWFLALRVLTQENPVSPEDARDFRLVTQAWLRWGEERGYL